MSYRQVCFPAAPSFSRHEELQIAYLNFLEGRLIPSTEVRFGDRLALRINRLGCKGPELSDTSRVVAFFGDDAAFGTGADAWPLQVRVGEHEVLNAAVEGHLLSELCTRFDEVRAQLTPEVVVHCGSWLQLVHEKPDEAYWRASFRYLSGPHQTALCTLPTPLSESSCQAGLDPLIATGNFAPLGNWPTSPKRTRQLLELVQRYNDAVREHCARSGAVLIDLYAACRPRDAEDATRLFSNPACPRPALYPQLAEAASAALARSFEHESARRLRQDISAKRRASRPHVPLEAQAAERALEGGTYPLW